MEYIKALVEYINDHLTESNLEELERGVWKSLQEVLSLSNAL